MLFKIKLKTHTSNSGTWRRYAGRGKRNENRGSIKCGKLKGGKLDEPIQCCYAKHFTLRPVRVLFGSNYGVSQKNPCRLATLNGVTHGLLWRPF